MKQKPARGGPDLPKLSSSHLSNDFYMVMRLTGWCSYQRHWYLSRSLCDIPSTTNQKYQHKASWSSASDIIHWVSWKLTIKGPILKMWWNELALRSLKVHCTECRISAQIPSENPTWEQAHDWTCLRFNRGSDPEYRDFFSFKQV